MPRRGKIYIYFSRWVQPPTYLTRKIKIETYFPSIKAPGVHSGKCAPQVQHDYYVKGYLKKGILEPHIYRFSKSMRRSPFPYLRYQNWIFSDFYYMWCTQRLGIGNSYSYPRNPVKLERHTSQFGRLD